MSKTTHSITSHVDETFGGIHYIDEFEIDVIGNYLEDVAKSSIRTALVYATVLSKFFNYVRKHPVTTTKVDLIEYLNWVDSHRFADAYNKTTMSVLKKFFGRLEDACDMAGITFKNPVPSSYKFTPKEIRARQSRVQKILNAEQEEKLLKHAYSSNRQDYVLFLLMIRCGIRIEEALSIRIEDINFAERYLLTGIEPTCQKSSRHLGAALEVPFSPEVGAMLKDYVMFLNRPSGFLFASNSSTGYLTQPCVQGRIKRVYATVVGVNFTCHWFRHTLITERKRVFNGEGGKKQIMDWESEVIMNHIPHSVENRVYLEKPVEFKRALYDKYDPFKNMI